MKFEEIYQNSKEELSSLQSRLAVTQSRVDEICRELDLDPTKDLKEQITPLREKIEKNIKDTTESIEKLLKELESINISTDGPEFE